MLLDRTAPAAIAVVPSPTLRTAEDVAAAFLAGYGDATGRAYATDLAAWGRWLSPLGLANLDAAKGRARRWIRRTAVAAGASPAGARSLGQ